MDILIIGAGGHGRVVLDILRLSRTCNPVAFLDADISRANTTVAGLPVLGGINLLSKLKKQGIAAAICAIGDNRTRRSYAQLVRDHGLDLVNAIHPAAVISSTANLGLNLVIAAGAVVGTDAKVADSVIINTNCVVDHECELAEACHICPGALLAGRVRVGAKAFVGLGAKLLPCLQIGENAVVGAGAVVLHDVPHGATVVGVPARIIKQDQPDPL